MKIIIQGMLSNSVPPICRFFRQNPQWSHYHLFDPIIVSAEVGSKKGDEGNEIYIQAENCIKERVIIFCDDQKKYAVDIPTQLNQKEGSNKKWVGIWTPEFERVASTIESAVNSIGIRI